MNNPKIVLNANPNKIKSFYVRKWIAGFEQEKNWETANTQIQNLMSWYWGENDSIKATEIFDELSTINETYGYELDLGKETWNRVIDYMTEMNNGNSLSHEWQTHFYKLNAV